MQSKNQEETRREPACGARFAGLSNPPTNAKVLEQKCLVWYLNMRKKFATFFKNLEQAKKAHTLTCSRTNLQFYFSIISV